MAAASESTTEVYPPQVRIRNMIECALLQAKRLKKIANFVPTIADQLKVLFAKIEPLQLAHILKVPLDLAEELKVNIQTTSNDPQEPSEVLEDLEATTDSREPAQIIEDTTKKEREENTISQKEDAIKKEKEEKMIRQKENATKKEREENIVRQKENTTKKEIGGRAIRVKYRATPPKEDFQSRGPRVGGGGSDLSKRLYVGNLSWDVDDQALESLFSEQGKVLEARVVYDRETGRSRGFGFVTYSSNENLNNALSSLNGADLDGRNIRVSVAGWQRGQGASELIRFSHSPLRKCLVLKSRLNTLEKEREENIIRQKESATVIIRRQKTKQ